MGKKRYFLGILASLFIAFFTGNVLAAGYSCPTYKKYTSCNNNYYMSGGQVAGNSCKACGSNSSSSGGTASTCTCTAGYSADGTASGATTSTSGCTLISVTCAAGKYLPKATTACAACPEGQYCAGGKFNYSSSADQGITGTCPSDYPNSDEGSSAITNCYSNTKSRPWTGSETACAKPSNCATVSCNSCSNPACDYVAYSNASGNGDGTVKSGCSTNNATCQQTVKSVTANGGYYTSGTTCAQCPADYRDGAGATSQAECVGEFSKTGSQQTPSTPSGCSSITTGTCTPGTCTYTKKYGASGDGAIVNDCTPTNCTKPITGVTASKDHYANSQTCPACESGYTTSGSGATSASQCTKSCTVACTSPAQSSCPANSQSCTWNTSESTSGTMNQVTKTCSATAEACTLKDFVCKTGYDKNTSSKTCTPHAYSVSYSCGTGTGNAPGGTSQPYNGTYQIATNTCTKPGYTFTGWSDGTTVKQPGQITWTYTNDITFTAQWSPCANDTDGAGTCGCSATQYPNGSGCSNCSVSCSSVSGFTLGQYNVCQSQTDSICYRNCTTSDVPNASAVSGTVTKGGTKTCAATSCNENFYLSGSGCAACVPNATCPGGGESFECKPGYHLSDDQTSCEPDVYSITLKKNGGTGTINGSTGTNDAVQSCKHGQLCDLPSTGLTRTGYAFTGWGESAACTSGNYQMTFTGAKTLYACWSQQTTACQAGKYYDGSSHVDCPAGKYCPGTGLANIGTPGCSADCPNGGTSTTGATANTQCYVACTAKTITGGTTKVVNDKEYYTGSAYPSCTYTVSCNVGYVASGNNTANPTCTKCEDGVNCPGGGDEGQPEECPAGSYCEDGVKEECPAGGTSDKGAGAITDCYKTCPTPGTIDNGILQNVQKQAHYNGSAYETCTFKAVCDEGFTAKDSPGVSPSCVWADPDACPAGSYCPDGSEEPIACPDGGTSDVGSKYITDCYKIFDPYEEFENGVASAKCNYQTSTTKYDYCKILQVKSCKAGYWYSEPGAFLCSGVSSGYYSPEGAIDATACPTDASGTVASTELADSYEDCYKTCQITVAHSTSVAAKENTVNAISPEEYAACSFAVTCEKGYTVANNNTAKPSCAANKYTIMLDKNGGTGNVVASIECIFDSSNCQLPSTTGLTKPGYTVAGKWCSNASGDAPCYNAGEVVKTNISADGTDTTLFAVWTPNIYTVNLDHQAADTDGAPETVYLKYATGWFANQNATTAISEMTQLPAKTGYEFTGYYSQTSGGVQVVNARGNFSKASSALTMTTTSPATIYARWSAGSTNCDAGTYYTGTGTTCAPCEANNYCPGGTFATDSGEPEGQYQCPENGISVPNSESAAACYKTKLPYAPAHGDGTQRCYYDEDGGQYTAKCDTMQITSCDAGYWLENPDDIDCTAVGTGYYNGGNSTQRSQCPNGGTTETETSTKIQDCFKTGLVYNATYGSGTQRCFYSDGEGTSARYERECDTKRIDSCRGGYWLAEELDEDCVAVGLNYYSPADDTKRYACEGGGETRGETSDSAKLCFKAGQAYDGQHGSGNRVCFYTSGTGADAVYSSSCETPTMTYCDAGYYYAPQTKPDDCIEVGKGYYSPIASVERTQCLDGGTTKTSTSAAASECYKDALDCAIENGAGQQTCNYDEDADAYSASCTTCTVTECDEGFSQVGNTCISCPEGSVCEGGTQKTCASLTGGQYPMSDAGTTDVALCYRECALAENAAQMSGRDYYDAPDTCEITRCAAGFRYENGVCTPCPEGSFCDGTVDPGEGGEDVKSCADLGDGSWEFSAPGATDSAGCYKKCEAYTITNGTAIPVNDKAFYPNDCEYKGQSDTGNPCDIVDDKCVETSCISTYEMIDGVCVPCERDFALSYKPTGNCVIASCITGYHPNGQVCEEDITECEAPNALYAEQKWDYKLNAFGTCIIKECEDGFHLASNACVSDIQPCNVENGTGVKEWNHATNNWDECEATFCDPGYTNDPSETNERGKPCGQCKNKFSVLGELAASSYVQGCEIASCMYQGEMYNLDNNECVPICDVDGYEDETGTMKWDPVRKKCVRTCKEGYTMW